MGPFGGVRNEKFQIRASVSPCLSVCLSACNNSGTPERTFNKFGSRRVSKTLDQNEIKKKDDPPPISSGTRRVFMGTKTVQKFVQED
jgi:hypothetical protein